MKRAIPNQRTCDIKASSRIDEQIERRPQRLKQNPQYVYRMGPGRKAENAFEYLRRRLSDIQTDAESLRLEVDRYSYKAKTMILERTEG
jgi:hypothetical protein